MRIKKKAALAVALAVSLGAIGGGLVACSKDDPAPSPTPNNDVETYYISGDLANVTGAGSWTTYGKDATVPSNVKFTKTNTANVYSLSVSLAEDDEFAVLTAGKSFNGALGYEVVTGNSDGYFEESEEGYISVTQTGSYTLTLTVSSSGSNTLTYTCVPEGEEPPGDDTVDVTGVSLNYRTLSLAVGDTAATNLVATVAPNNADDKTVTWSVSPANVINFNKETGAIEAVGKGTATITVTTNDGGFTDSCVVTVSNPCTDITLSSSRNMVVGGSLRLAATITPDDTDDVVSWSLNTEDIAVATLSETTTTPDADGKVYTTVTASAAGTARVSVTCGGVTKTCVVNVSATSLEITGEEVLDVNGSAITLGASVNDSSGAVGTQPTISWAAYSDEACETTSNGVSLNVNTGASISVTGITVGKVYVKATCEYEGATFTAVHEINVVKKATGIALTSVKLYDGGTAGAEVTATGGTYMLEKGHDYVVAYTLSGDPTTGYKTVAWSSSSTANATVTASTSSGLAVVTVNERGAATITGTINGQSVTIPVQGIVTATSMSVSVAGTPVENGGTVHVARGGTAQITVADVLPAENDSTVTYMSDSTDYATVSATGLITATAAKTDGTITITVKCGNATVEFTLVVDVNITVSFAEDLYKINVNNGGSAWTTTVSATADGSSSGVTYSIVSDNQITANTDVSERVEVNSTSGVVTASQIGRYVVTATSVEDSTKTATTTVYVTSTVGDTSNSAFLALCSASGWQGSIVFPTTTAVPTSHSDFRFESTDTADVYEVSNLALKSGETVTIAFLGMDSSWDKKMTGDYVVWDSTSSEYLDSNAGDATFGVNTYAEYTIKLDLRSTLPIVTVEQGDLLQESEKLTVYVVLKDTTTHLGEGEYDPDNPNTVTFTTSSITISGWSGHEIRFGTEGANANYEYSNSYPSDITWSGTGVKEKTSSNNNNVFNWESAYHNNLWFGYNNASKTFTITCKVTIAADATYNYLISAVELTLNFS